MDILDIGMRDVTLRPYFTEIFFENGETREFMDRLLLECRLDKGLTKNLSHRSRNLLLKIFDESKFLRRDLLDTLNIEKLLLLDISARIQNHDGIVTKLHSEALATGKQIEVYLGGLQVKRGNNSDAYKSIRVSSICIIILAFDGTTSSFRAL